jgi:hypothetical protein
MLIHLNAVDCIKTSHKIQEIHHVASRSLRKASTQDYRLILLHLVRTCEYYYVRTTVARQANDLLLIIGSEKP